MIEYKIVDLSPDGNKYSLRTLILYFQELIGYDENGDYNKRVHTREALDDGWMYSILLNDTIYMYWWEWDTEFSKKVEDLIKLAEEK